jgi:hypothetical protein
MRQTIIPLRKVHKEPVDVRRIIFAQSLNIHSVSFSPFFLERSAYPLVHDLISDDCLFLRLEFRFNDTQYPSTMDIHSSKQIADFNRFFEPNPFNTGPPIPPPALLALLFEIECEPLMESNLDSEISTPELSSSPTSTAPSSPQSSRSALSLDDPEIRKIWEDPRFGPVVHDGTPPELNNFTSALPFQEEEYTLLNTPTFLKEGFGGRDPFASAGSLNPLAQPFVPCFIVQDIQNSITWTKSLRSTMTAPYFRR